jgi:hypothetical protein
MPFWRSYLEYTYTSCALCQRKVPIEDCEWKGGFLVCKMYDCLDRNVNGAFEYATAQEASRDRQELTPDPKLIHPKDVLLDIQNINASAGTY